MTQAGAKRPPMPFTAGAALPPSADVVVAGGGLVGASIAWGLVRKGLRVVILDEGDLAFRASRGNFGLIWVQGKGLDAPVYAHLTLDSAEAWPGFARELTLASDIAPMMTEAGGYGFCFSEEEFAGKAAAMARLSEQTGGRFRYRILDAEALRAALPWIGPTVAGAVRSPHDRAANPLMLLRGLHVALGRHGAYLRPESPVRRIAPQPGGGFVVETETARIAADRVVLAAGLGNAALAPMVGLCAPVRPVRGQILVTARMAPFLADATNVLRQMPEGGCLIGDTSEEAGLDPGVRPPSLAWMAARALRLAPALRHAEIVRSWGALRVMTPDGLPIYQQSAAHPGAWLATVHSGVTLAPIHAGRIADAVTAGEMPAALAPLSGARFRGAETRQPEPAHH